MKTIGKAIYEFHNPTPGLSEVPHKHERVSAKALGLPESWFRDAIFQEPELVIAPCRAAGLVQESESWIPWYTEYPLTDTGRVDVVLLSSSGQIALVETKLSSNPEQRREVLAQLLDYSQTLQAMNPAEFRDKFPRHVASPTYEDFTENFDAGEFLLIVAGDDLDPRAVRLGEGLLGRHLTSGWDLAMVDLNLFRSSSNLESVFIVPALRGAVIADKRQVVKVVVEDRKGATVKVERAPSGESISRDTSRGIEAMRNRRAAMEATNQAAKDSLAKLINMLHDNKYITKDNTGGVAIYKEDGESIYTLLKIDEDGWQIVRHQIRKGEPLYAQMGPNTFPKLSGIQDKDMQIISKESSASDRAGAMYELVITPSYSELPNPQLFRDLSR